MASWKTRIQRILFNLFPVFRNTGARITYLAEDEHLIKLKLPLKRSTRNYVGTIYGGTMYSALDGILMVMFGGYWFWFFIRVDVASEGNSPFRLVRADLFVVALVLSVTLALLWELVQASGSVVWANIFLTLYIIATTVLFGSVPWSKFSHMFFKPAAAFEKRVSNANGSRNNLPEPADRTNPADRDRHSMELLKDAPSEMGLGIKREAPRHY